MGEAIIQLRRRRVGGVGLQNCHSSPCSSCYRDLTLFHFWRPLEAFPQTGFLIPCCVCEQKAVSQLVPLPCDITHKHKGPIQSDLSEKHRSCTSEKPFRTQQHNARKQFNPNHSNSEEQRAKWHGQIMLPSDGVSHPMWILKYPDGWVERLSTSSDQVFGRHWPSECGRVCLLPSTYPTISPYY